LLERSGLRGLGFSIGVATNLLPDLRQSSTNAWHSLRMKGGFRAQWKRGVQLLVVTIFSNALRHAEQIVLAAEVRAFRPELSRKASLRMGVSDWWLVGGLSILGIFLIFG
jgi:energy-coupling factor transporter transmembrane protein EcfT